MSRFEGQGPHRWPADAQNPSDVAICWPVTAARAVRRSKSPKMSCFSGERHWPRPSDARNQRKCRDLGSRDAGGGRQTAKISQHVAIWGPATAPRAVRRSKSAKMSRSEGQRQRRGPADGRNQRKYRDLRGQRRRQGRQTVKIGQNVAISGSATLPTGARSSKLAKLSRLRSQRRRRGPSDGHDQPICRGLVVSEGAAERRVLTDG